MPLQALTRLSFRQAKMLPGAIPVTFWSRARLLDRFRSISCQAQQASDISVGSPGTSSPITLATACLPRGGSPSCIRAPSGGAGSRPAAGFGQRSDRPELPYRVRLIRRSRWGMSPAVTGNAAPTTRECRRPFPNRTESHLNLMK